MCLYAVYFGKITEDINHNMSEIVRNVIKH
jgi:hypothetical protein